MVFHLVLRQCYIVNFFSYMFSWPRSMPYFTYRSAFALFRSCLGSHTHSFELTLKAWTIHSFSLFGSTTPLSTTPTSSLPPWASFILFNRARNNLKTNLKAAQTLAIVHPFLLTLTHPTILRPHRELPGLPTLLPGGLFLPVLCRLAIYRDLVFTYARDLALALVRPDLSFTVSPHTLPGSSK